MVVHKIIKQHGVAGSYAYHARIQYPDEPPTTITFHGSIYGPPIVMTTPANPGGVIVRNPERFGDTLNEGWVRKFFGTGG